MVTVGGILTGLQRRLTKKGDPWASATLEDLAGGVEVAFFPKVYLDCALLLAEDAIVLVKGRVARSEDRLSLHAQQVVVPDLSAPRQGPGAGQHRGDPLHAAGGRPAARRPAGASRAPRPCTCKLLNGAAADDAAAGRRAAGDPDVGADGRSEGAARRGLPGVNRFAGLSRAHGLVASAAVLLGVVQGVAWAYLAPGVPYRVLPDGRYGALPTT